MGAGGGFWAVIDEVCQRSQDLSALRGKRLAIDLSFWIVQQDAALQGAALKPHLRVTFFRVVYIVAKLGALPVFVVDGEAPALKLQARVQRYRRISGISQPSLHTSDGFSYPRNAEFLAKVEECVELLNLLGVPVLRAKSEAEALCAQLEREGVVDACVTPDSDAFLHGANWVIYALRADYRKPLMESCKAADVKEHYKLGRAHLIALALLVGCDFNNRGVSGIGYAKALPLVRHFKESQIIHELRKWGAGQYPSPEEIERLNADDVESVDEPEAVNAGHITTRADPHCSQCGHPGNKRLHTSQGCCSCLATSSKEDGLQGCMQKTKGFKCTCPSCENVATKKRNASRIAWWSRIRAKISASPGFPNEEIIDFFLNPKGCSHLADTGKPLSELEWKVPKVEQLERFLKQHLHWDCEHTREKTLPLLAHFCLKSLADASSPVLVHGKYAPDSILRRTKLLGRPLYVVTWKPVDGVFENGWRGLKSESRKSKRTTDEEHFTTEEDASVLKRACPKLVEEFEAAQKKRATKRKTKNAGTSQTLISSFLTPLSKNPTLRADTVETVNLDSEDINTSVRRRLF